MASPPGGPSAGPGRVPAWVVVGAAAVLVLGGLGVAALLFTGHKKSDTAVATSSGTGTASTTTSVVGAPSSTSASAPVAGPTDAETQAFGEHYLALVEPSRQAWADYLQADDLASRTPCTCPAGEYDYRPAIPAIEALVTVWQSQLPELDAMASAAPPVVSGDFDTFVAVRRREIAAGRAMANPPPGSAMGAIFTEWVAALTASSDASAAVRADLGLPPPH